MPTTYAHDLFGKKVYQKLPEEVKKVIRENGELYRIGLHGPDILFYFMVTVNPVTQFGVQMHKERARMFFEQGMQQVRETKNPALLSYMLGFGCHYLLDSACHPYVNETDSCGIASHTLLEIEFDRFLMLKTDKDPYHFYPSDCIVPRKSHAQLIHQVLPLVRACNIYVSLRMMKYFTNLMVCDDGGRRRKWIGRLLRFSPKEHISSRIDHFMTKTPAPQCAQPVEELYSLFLDTAKKAPEELMELYHLSKEEGHLSERWDKTYNG